MSPPAVGAGADGRVEAAVLVRSRGGDESDTPTRKWSPAQLGQGPHECQRVLLGRLGERDVDRQRLEEAQICSVCSLRDEMPSELNEGLFQLRDALTSLGSLRLREGK